MTTKAQNKAQEKYDKVHTKSVHLKLNIKTDKDIINWLDSQPIKQGAIKDLIRKQLKSQQQ